MKKIYFLLIGLISVIYTSGQSNRLVLIEEATNASCGPCASQNPAFDLLLNQNRDKLTAIKYHWYYPGYDPFQNQNPDEHNARVAYYGINGVPTATIDGVIPDGPTFSYPGGPHGYTQALIDEYYAVPSPFDIYISHQISDDQDSIYINMMIVANDTVGGNLVAQMAVVEKEVHFASPPGSNGEKDFYDVMRKMVPDENGTQLPAQFLPGDYIILQDSWEMHDIYDMSQVGVVGFIQNNNGKGVKQAGNSSTDPLTPLYNREAELNKVMNIPETDCNGDIAPKIIIRNDGADPLTSLEIKYHVNGNEEYTYNWSGNLNFLESEEVDLPMISFPVESQNQVIVYTDNPNGQPDEYTRNDTIVQAFDRAAITPLTVGLLIRTDNNPQETTWEVLNSSGEVAASGGPYANAGTMYSEQITLDDQECYKFRIYDAGGDGLQVPGFYTLYYGSNNIISSGTQFGSVDSAFFEVNTTVGIQERGTKGDLKVFPNPFTQTATMSYFLGQPSQVKFEVYNPAGVLVLSGTNNKTAGFQSQPLDASNLKPGLYILRLNTGTEIYTKRITIIN